MSRRGGAAATAGPTATVAAVVVQGPTVPRYVRVATDDGPRFGVVDGAEVALLDGHPFGGGAARSGSTLGMEGLRLLAPVIPTKVVAVGRNYADHARELGHDTPSRDDLPLLFLKPSSAVIGPGDVIQLPSDLSEEVHHEAELAVVIGRVLTRATPDEAADAVFGYTCANDVTARDLQRREDQWLRAKGFDTFCPLGPAIETELDPLERLAVICRVNGDVRQAGFTSDMVFGVAEIIEFASRVMTLLPGDVVLTGTPSGVGPIEVGDVVEVEIDGVGVLVNTVGQR